MNGIKNILFDLGAVLINIDFQKVTRSFVDLGVEDFEKKYAHLSADALFEKLETGRISEQDFYDAMIGQANMGATREDIRVAWVSILQDFRVESMQFLHGLAGKYRLFLLSNTNSIHLAEMQLKVRHELGAPSLESYFERAYFSHLIKCRKPGKKAFKYVLEDAGIMAEDTIFIDDAPPNIETASEMGFRTHLLLPGERIERIGLFR